MKERLLNGKIEGEEEGFFSCPQCGSADIYQWRQVFLNTGRSRDNEDYVKCGPCGSENPFEDLARNGEVEPRGDPLVHRPAPRLEVPGDAFQQRLARYQVEVAAHAMRAHQAMGQIEINIGALDIPIPGPIEIAPPPRFQWNAIIPPAEGLVGNVPHFIAMDEWNDPGPRE